MRTLGVGIDSPGQKAGQPMPCWVTQGTFAGVRDQDGTLSAFSVEQCPPSRRNAVRHQSGTVSGMAWKTQPQQDVTCIAANRSHRCHLVTETRREQGRDLNCASHWPSSACSDTRTTGLPTHPGRRVRSPDAQAGSWGMAIRAHQEQAGASFVTPDFVLTLAVTLCDPLR